MHWCQCRTNSRKYTANGPSTLVRASLVLSRYTRFQVAKHSRTQQVLVSLEMLGGRERIAEPELWNTSKSLEHERSGARQNTQVV